MNSANGGDIIFHFKGDDSQLKDTTNNFKGMTKSILAATGVTKVLSASFRMLTGSMDAAISRYDTMNNFPRVMSNLGIANEEAEKSIEKMSEALIGLPTTLDQGAMAVQRFTSANGDVAKSTDLFLAVNNAILAGGASAEIQASALEQISQAYAKGKPDMLEWRTLMTAMPAQLKQVSSAMGYVSSAALGEAVREDSDEFLRMMETIIQLNETGIEGFANFEQQARGATNGISTAVTNMKSRIATGVAEMIGAVSKGLEKGGLGGLAPLLEQIGSSIRDMLTGLAPKITKIITFIATKLPPILKFFKGVVPVLLPILAALKTYEMTVGLIKKATMLWNTAQALLNGTLMLNPIGLIVAAIVALIAIIVLLWTKCEWFRNFWVSVWEVIVQAVTGAWELLKSVFDIIVNFVKENWQTILLFLINPFAAAFKYIYEHSEKFRNFINNLVSGIIDFFKKLPSEMLAIGMNVVKGIGKGITNGYDWLKNKIKSFVGNVTDFIKKVFKIGSPSVLMEKQVGQWIPKGIAVGIDANTNSLEKSMEKMRNSVLESFQLSPSLANSLHYSPNVIVNNEMNLQTDPLGQVVGNIKTFANGSKNDYNYGMGV